MFLHSLLGTAAGDTRKVPALALVPRADSAGLPPAMPDADGSIAQTSGGAKNAEQTASSYDTWRNTIGYDAGRGLGHLRPGQAFIPPFFPTSCPACRCWRRPSSMSSCSTSFTTCPTEGTLCGHFPLSGQKKRWLHRRTFDAESTRLKGSAEDLDPTQVALEGGFVDRLTFGVSARRCQGEGSAVPFDGRSQEERPSVGVRKPIALLHVRDASVCHQFHSLGICSADLSSGPLDEESPRGVLEWHLSQRPP